MHATTALISNTPLNRPRLTIFTLIAVNSSFLPSCVKNLPTRLRRRRRISFAHCILVFKIRRRYVRVKTTIRLDIWDFKIQTFDTFVPVVLHSLRVRYYWLSNVPTRTNGFVFRIKENVLQTKQTLYVIRRNALADSECGQDNGIHWLRFNKPINALESKDRGKLIYNFQNSRCCCALAVYIRSTVLVEMCTRGTFCIPVILKCDVDGEKNKKNESFPDPNADGFRSDVLLREPFDAT